VCNKEATLFQNRTLDKPAWQMPWKYYLCPMFKSFLDLWKEQLEKANTETMGACSFIGAFLKCGKANKA